MAAALAMQKKIKKRKQIRCVPKCGRGMSVEAKLAAIQESWEEMQAEIKGDSEEEQNKIRELFNNFDPEIADEDHKEKQYGNIILDGAFSSIFDPHENTIWLMVTNADTVKELLLEMMEDEKLIELAEPVTK